MELNGCQCQDLILRLVFFAHKLNKGIEYTYIDDDVNILESLPDLQWPDYDADMNVRVPENEDGSSEEDVPLAKIVKRRRGRSYEEETPLTSKITNSQGYSSEEDIPLARMVRSDNACSLERTLLY